MPSSLAKTRKPLVAGLLILVAGLLGLLARAPQSTPARLPAMGPAFTAAHVVPVGVSAPGDSGGPFRQWTVQDASGNRALVYVQATREPQRVLAWTGQLGYQGEGYQVSRLGTRRLDRPAPTGELTTAHLTGPQDELTMAATDVGPDGFSVGGVSAAPRLLLDEVDGRRSLWYLVRVTVVGSGSATTDQATRLLESLVPALARDRSART